MWTSVAWDDTAVYLLGIISSHFPNTSSAPVTPCVGRVERATDREMSELKQVGGYVHAKGQPGMERWSPSKRKGVSVWEGSLE